MSFRKILVITAGLLAGCAPAWFDDDTRYAPGYSEVKFKRVKEGMSTNEVIELIGKPLQVATQSWSEVWSYSPTAPEFTHADRNLRTYDLFGKFTQLSFTDSGVVKSVRGDYLEGDFIGLTKEEVLVKAGKPAERVLTDFAIVYYYSLRAGSGTYRARLVYFDSSGIVSSTVTAVSPD